MVMIDAVTAPTCFLCGCMERQPAGTLSGQELRDLWRAIGRSIDEAAWEALSPGQNVTCFRCTRCGFEHFDPRWAGSAPFYAELNRDGYYVSWRPEFSRTLSWAKKRRFATVLDVGCGRGEFLDLARNAGLKTFGIELNRDGAVVAREKGHSVFSCLLEQLKDESPQTKFDLITCFQVMEHVPDPVGLLRQALGFLAPGGQVSVSVPNSFGLYWFHPSDPYQWPPHHISRWRKADLVSLGRAAAAELVQLGGDPLYGGTMLGFWRQEAILRRVLGKKQMMGSDVAARMVSMCYRKLGLKYVFRNSGISLFAAYSNRE